ncbi:DUF92 domain-containing protein [Sporobolomyces koalae]|uniref:DUF92 domain-containing protein n=1 Tax=Sporobolomyces koalae TaxID=500713 RepID=UPI00317EB597
MIALHLPALLISALAALRGLRSTSLSASGATAAFFFGYTTLASPLRLFGVCLLGFYLAGSKATKVKANVKATFEEPEHAPPVSNAARTGAADKKVTVEGGRRTATQVACNALVGSVCSILWRILYSGEVSTFTGWNDATRWCVVAKYDESDPLRWSRVLVMAAVAFWSACCGDTFASELGILAKSPPILITRPFAGYVPRGTNGGITVWGLFVSLLGGTFVGALAVTCLIAQGQANACSAGGRNWSWAIELLTIASLSGLGGSLLDSFLGALFQPTLYSRTRKLVVHRQHPVHASKVDDVIVIPGTAVLGPRLSNNGVNAVMGFATSVAVAVWVSV